MTTYVMRKVPARVTTFTDEGPEEKASDVMLVFTPDEAGYPLGVGIEALNVLVTLPMDQLIEKIKNDLKEGKL